MVKRINGSDSHDRALHGNDAVWSTKRCSTMDETERKILDTESPFPFIPSSKPDKNKPAVRSQYRLWGGSSGWEVAQVQETLYFLIWTVLKRVSLCTNSMGCQLRTCCSMYMLPFSKSYFKILIRKVRRQNWSSFPARRAKLQKGKGGKRA